VCLLFKIISFALLLDTELLFTNDSIVKLLYKIIQVDYYAEKYVIDMYLW